MKKLSSFAIVIVSARAALTQETAFTVLAGLDNEPTPAPRTLRAMARAFHTPFHADTYDLHVSKVDAAGAGFHLARQSRFGTPRADQRAQGREQFRDHRDHVAGAVLSAAQSLNP